MLTITAAELVTRIRERTRRENSPFLADAEYLRLVDVAWRRCYNRMAKKVPRYFTTDYNLTIVPGQALYTLPSTFRSLQAAFIKEPSWDSNVQIRPLQESELAAFTVPQEGTTVLLKYTPEPSRVTDPTDALPVIATSDEWIVNCVVQMSVTKEGTDRTPYDVDFKILDMELEEYLDDFDQGWPQSINEVFPYGSSYPYPRTVRIEGYVLRGTLTSHEIEFWAYKFPALYP